MARKVKSILLDTNLLVYLYIQDSDKQKKIKALIKTKTEEKVNLVIAEQSLLEFYSVITNPKQVKNPMPADLARQEVDKFYNNNAFQIICPNKNTFPAFLKLIRSKNVSGSIVFDYYLAATALSHQVKVIYTENQKDFRSIKSIKTASPF